MTISKQDMQDAFERALRNYGFGASSRPSPSAAPADWSNANAVLGPLRDGISKAGDAARDLTQAAKDNLEVWRDLSKNGSNFSNDLVGLSVAAAQSRVSLIDFSDIVKDNGKFLTGMGGSVTRGTEAFARLSKEFFESSMTDDMRNMGYTTREMNELLAFQVGIRKSDFRDDKENRERAIQAASDLAKEMDAMAKLTGKSRQEQMEAMKRDRVNGQVEAKFRLMSQGKTEEEIAEMRRNYEEGLLQARLRGTEQAYMEFFATGTYLSEQAATQASLHGNMMRAQEAEIKSIQSGRFDEALAERAKAQAESLNNANNFTILALATFGSAAGTAGESTKKFVEDTDAFYHSIVSVARSNDILLKSQQDYARAIALAIEEIDRSLKGRTPGSKEGTDVRGVTRAVLDIEKGAQELKAGVAGVVTAIDRDGNSIAGALRKSGEAISDAYQVITSGQVLGKIIEDRAKLGQQPVAVDTTGMGRDVAKLAENQGKGGFVGSATNAASKLANATAKTFSTGILDIANELKFDNVTGRATGSLGETGKLIEDFGQGTLTMLHGKEGVITENQLKNMAMGIQSYSIDSSIKELKSAIPKVDENASFATDLFKKITKQSIEPIINSTTIDLNSLNLPGFGPQIKSAATTIAPAVNSAAKQETQSAPKPATNQSANNSANSSTQNQTSATKTSTLDDVVKGLDMLNMKMGQLITQQADLMNKQIRTTRSAGSSNIYERTM